MGLMRRVGVHTSIVGGLHLSLKRAKLLGCNTVQIFSHNPRSWIIKELSEKDISLFKLFRLKFDITPIYIHSSYLINIASQDSMIRHKSIELLRKEMERADIIGADYIILHPGSASNEDRQFAIKRAIHALNELANRGKWNAGLLIENTAGEQGDISSTIKDLAELIYSTNRDFISGICIDTCHAFAAGYDIRDEKKMEIIFSEIKKYIGFEMIKLIHLNDSKGEVGSHIDRHEHIGKGKIRLKGLRQFINYEHIKNVPIILETPRKRDIDDLMNLKIVRKMIKSK